MSFLLFLIVKLAGILGASITPLKQKEVASFVCLHKLCLLGLVETKMRAENLVSAVKFSFPKH